MVKIKICGLNRSEDIHAVNLAKPDYIGFVFAESKRCVTPAQAQSLRYMLDADILAVGVFLNQKIEYIMQIVHAGTIDLIQLHGQEDIDYINQLRQMTDLPVIKAVSITQAGDAQQAEQLPVDYLLLDYKDAGSGQSFDWNQIGIIHKPFFLAGGINVDNVDKALKYQPFALDTSSGVETNGCKDLDKIIQLVRRIRNEQR